MDRAVRIAGTLTNAMNIILKEPSINAGRHAKALEQLTNIFETATEKLEKSRRMVCGTRMGSLLQHDIPNTLHRRNPHGSIISTIPKTREGPTKDTNGQIRAHCRNPHQRNKENAKGTKYRCRKT